MVLTEACFGHKNKYGIRMNYQDIFKYPYYSHAPAVNQGYEWGTAILSKYPIKATNLSEAWKMLLRAQVDIMGKPVNLDVVHMTPNVGGDEKKRFFEKHLKEFKKPFILAGDLNSLSHQDNYNTVKLVRGFGTFNKEPEKVVRGMLDDPTIPYLLSKGLRDTYKQAHRKFDYTVPTDFLSSNKDSGVRFDYIFCSPDVLVKNTQILKNKYTNIASDHYPVTAELEIN